MPDTTDRYLVNFTELCQILGCSRPSLRDAINSHADIPVVRRGSKASAWQFDLREIVPWWIRNLPVEAVANGVATWAERKRAAEAALLEDRLKLSRGELAEVPKLRVVLTAANSALVKELMRVPVELRREHGLDHSQYRAVEQLLRNALERHVERLTDHVQQRRLLRELGLDEGDDDEGDSQS